jgi:hypothetical protein
MLEARQKGKIKKNKKGGHSRKRDRDATMEPRHPPLSDGSSRSGWSKVQKAYRLPHPVVDSFDPAFHEIGLMPEVGSLPVLHESFHH